MQKKRIKKEKKNIKKIILIVLGIIITISIIGLLVLDNKSTAKEELKLTPSLRTKQQKLEKEFKSEGYTLVDPSVIVDPYDNSPLTALIIFETKDEEKVKITIKGKDELTTYTHEFDKEKVHYIPVYWFPYYENIGYKRGLCPNAEMIYKSCMSIPLYPGMLDKDVEDVIECVKKVVGVYKKYNVK